MAQKVSARRNARNRDLTFEPLEDRQLLSVTTRPVVDISPVGQLIVELVNRGRANPAVEAARHGIGLNSGIPANSISTAAKAPLAPNQILTNTANAHSSDMLQKQYFAHDSRDGKTPGQRMSNAGYSFTLWGENLAYVGQTGSPVNPVNQALEVHSQLIKSTSGHRQTIFDPRFQEIGIGAPQGTFRGASVLMVTQDFGSRVGDKFLTGVAFVDNLTRDNFYTVQWVGGQYKHEGKAGVKIRAENVLSGAAFETTTGSSGGYALQLPNGTYVVTASGGGINTTKVTNVTLQGQNVKMDFGNHSTGTISGQVYNDTNGNGSVDSGEQGLANWAVYIDVNNNGKRDPGEPASTTNAAGSYSFGNLAAGATYRIGIDLQTGWRQTSQPATHSVALTAGQTASDRRFGVQQPQLSLQLPQITINEIGGSMTATVSRNSLATTSLVVNLSSSNRQEATVPASVTIPANAISTTFVIAAVHDNIADGPKVVTINATATGYLSTSKTLTVLDSDILATVEDTAITRRGAAVNIAVLQNDSHPSSLLADLIVEITSPPQSSMGTAQIVNKHLIRFTPASTFVGIATMRYAIRDSRLGVSQTALVRVGVPASAKQNPWSQWDVNGDGRITAQDALLIINRLNDPRASRIVDEISNPLVQPFVDVNGDGRITAHDALLVINRMNLRSQGEGEGGAEQTALVNPTAINPTLADATFHQLSDGLSWEGVWDWQDELRRRRRV
ncbi:MAG: carboxypeptidase regulatory-like domain-containing protein [Pirellulaceae bacterium]|nr:carboxypeptidase regulatory-like domain-containing protein [Pirellulaceae bacterium]